MGIGPSPRQSPSYERHHDVHVRKQSTDLQYHDGIHALQESYSRTIADKHCVYEV